MGVASEASVTPHMRSFCPIKILLWHTRRHTEESMRESISLQPSVSLSAASCGVDVAMQRVRSHPSRRQQTFATGRYDAATNVCNRAVRRAHTLVKSRRDNKHGKLSDPPGANTESAYRQTDRPPGIKHMSDAVFVGESIVRGTLGVLFHRQPGSTRRGKSPRRTRQRAAKGTGL